MGVPFGSPTSICGFVCVCVCLCVVSLCILFKLRITIVLLVEGFIIVLSLRKQIMIQRGNILQMLKINLKSYVTYVMVGLMTCLIVNIIRLYVQNVMVIIFMTHAICNNFSAVLIWGQVCLSYVSRIFLLV